MPSVKKKSKSEIDEIMKKFGNGAIILYSGFKEFMISVLGVSDTKEDILNSFTLINRGDTVTKVDKMELVMEDNDIGYIKQTAQPANGGYNFTKWAEDVFSR